MKVLWITPKWPFPVADGARIATTQLVKNLSAKGVQVHLCALVPEAERIDEREAQKQLGVSRISLLRRPQASRLKQLGSLFIHPFFPVTLAPYRHPKLSQELAKLLQTEKFDRVVYDGLHSAAWRLGKVPPICSGLQEVYRAHNVESDLWFRAAKDTQNPLKKFLLRFQGFLVKRAEKTLVSVCGFTLPVSFADEAIFKTYEKRGILQTIPIGIQVETPSQPAQIANFPISRNILFVGKLDWPPNRDGLKWILERVWPAAFEISKDLSLCIVGSGDRTWLEKYRALPGLTIAGQVKELAPYYENCIATLVPVFYGSGTRVKAIESSMYGRICISTEIGVEGLGLIAGQTYLKAEQEKDWIKTLTELRAEEAIAKGLQARAYARTVFDPALIATHLIKILHSPLDAKKE